MFYATDTEQWSYDDGAAWQNIDLNIPAQATQSALEDETDEDSYAAPDMIKLSPGVAKSYCSVASDGTLQANSYNTASTVKDSAGNYTHTIGDDMGNANGSPVLNQEDINGIIRCSSIAAGTYTVHIRNLSQTDTDAAHNVTNHGDQV